MISTHLIFLGLITQCFAANVLYIIPFTSKSHYIMLRPIGLELARRGHNVTVITAFREYDPPPTYHQVLVDNTTIWEAIEGGRPNVFTSASDTAEKFHYKILWSGGLAFSEIAWKSKEVQTFLKADNQFDIVICEQFFEESMYVLAHKYNAPLALVTTFGNCMRHNELVGNPKQLANVIPEFLDIDNPTSFWGRLRVFYFTMYEHFWWRYWYMPKQEALVSKYVPDLPQPVPSLIEIQKNASLMLMNSHFSYDVPAAYLPNLIEIGGVHLKDSDNELPQDLKKILDEAKHGVIYMSFGSNVMSAELPEEKKRAFLNVFAGLKETVLWKWEEGDLNKTDNVFIQSWMPQKDILAHPNTKVFIAHGGLIGLQEATFFGVPVLGVPIYADQYNNLLRAEELGYAKILRFHEIEEKTLGKQLNEILKKDYKNNAMAMSKRFRDRPMTPLDTAMYWIEYVIRNKGAGYIKTPATRMNWIEYNMLDVYGFVFAAAFGSALALIKIVKVLTRNVTVKNDSKKIN